MPAVSLLLCFLLMLSTPSKVCFLFLSSSKSCMTRTESEMRKKNWLNKKKSTARHKVRVLRLSTCTGMTKHFRYDRLIDWNITGESGWHFTTSHNRFSCGFVCVCVRHALECEFKIFCWNPSCGNSKVYAKNIRLNLLLPSGNRSKSISLTISFVLVDIKLDVSIFLVFISHSCCQPFR